MRVGSNLLFGKRQAKGSTLSQVKNHGKGNGSRNAKRLDYIQTLSVTDEDSLFGGADTMRANPTTLSPHQTAGSINQQEFDHDSILEVDWLRQPSQEKKHSGNVLSNRKSPVMLKEMTDSANVTLAKEEFLGISSSC